MQYHIHLVRDTIDETVTLWISLRTNQNFVRIQSLRYHTDGIGRSKPYCLLLIGRVHPLMLTIVEPGHRPITAVCLCLGKPVTALSSSRFDSSSAPLFEVISVR